MIIYLTQNERDVTQETFQMCGAQFFGSDGRLAAAIAKSDHRERERQPGSWEDRQQPNRASTTARRESLCQTFSIEILIFFNLF